MSNNTEKITCPDCKSFVAENPDTPEQEIACLKECPDFMSQLISGQTKICKEAERK